MIITKGMLMVIIGIVGIIVLSIVYLVLCKKFKKERNKMIKILMIGMGGFLGSVSRYLTASLAQKISNNPFFPYGTMTVNIIGCFFISFFSGSTSDPKHRIDTYFFTMPYS